MNILFLEGDVDLLDMLSESCASGGHSALKCQTAQQALVWLETGVEVQLVITDYRPYRSDYFDFIQYLLKRSNRIPFIIFSDENEEFLRNCFSTLDNSFQVVKKADFQNLVGCIRNLNLLSEVQVVDKDAKATHS